MSLKGKYDFDYGELYDDKEVKSLLFEFLQEQRNEDCILFIRDVDNYSQLMSVKNRYNKALKIFNLYLEDGSSNQINLSNQVLSQIRLQFDKDCSLNDCPYDLFQSLKNEVFINLQMDVFPRFVQSDNFQEFLRVQQKEKKGKFLGQPVKKNESNLLKEGLSNRRHKRMTVSTTKLTVDTKVGFGVDTQKSPLSGTSACSSEKGDSIFENSSDTCTQELDQRNDEFVEEDGGNVLNIENIEGQDNEEAIKNNSRMSEDSSEGKLNTFTDISTKNISLKYVQGILNDIEYKDQWKVMKEKDDYSIYLSKNSVEMNGSATRKILRVGYFDYDYEKTFHVFTNDQFYRDTEKMLHSFDEIELKDEKPLASVLRRYVYKYPFPMSKRDYTIVQAAFHDKPNQRYIQVGKSCELEEYPKQKKIIRGKIMTMYTFEKVSENRCKYSQLYVAQLGGFLSNPNLKLIVNGADTHKKQKKHLELYMKKSTEELFKNESNLQKALKLNKDFKLEDLQ